MCPRAQKVHLCTTLGGQAHRRFRGFCVIIRDEVTLQIWLYDATTSYQRNLRTALTVL